MKYRLTATGSVPRVLAGEWRRNAFTGILRSSGRFYGQGLQSFRRVAHTLSCEDDFSELGPPVEENGAKLKLATEKAEIILKVNPVPKAKPSDRSFSESMPDWGSILRTLHAPETKGWDQKFSVPVKQNYSSKLDNCSSMEEDKSKNCVTAENTPSKFCLSHLAHNLAGELFLDSGVTPESIHLPVRPQQPSEIVTIRIEGIGLRTTCPTVHRICKSIGGLEGLAMDGKDAVNAFYRVKSDAELQKILGRLNNTIINTHNWSAAVVSDKGKDVDKSKLALRFNNRLADLKSCLLMQKMWSEDLEYLHMGILHLQGLPTVGDA